MTSDGHLIFENENEAQLGKQKLESIVLIREDPYFMSNKKIVQVFIIFTISSLTTIKCL